MADIKYYKLDLTAEITTRATAIGINPILWDELQTTFPADANFENKIEQLSAPTLAFTTIVQNNADTITNQILNVGELVSTVDTLTLMMSQGVTTNQNSNFSIGFQPYFGAGFTVGTSFTVDSSTTRSNQTTRQHSWNYSVTIPVNPGKHVRVDLMLTNSTITIPFSAEIQIQGRVKRQSFDVVIDAVVVGADRPDPPLFAPVGMLFTNVPHPEVMVIDMDTVKCKAKGNITGVIGKYIDTQITPIEPKSEASPSAPEVIHHYDR